VRDVLARIDVFGKEFVDVFNRPQAASSVDRDRRAQYNSSIQASCHISYTARRHSDIGAGRLSRQFQWWANPSRRQRAAMGRRLSLSERIEDRADLVAE
jgi:hypothetical protein